MSLSFKERLLEFDLPLEECIVAGSGILELLDIRRAADIDLIVTRSLYDRLVSSNENWIQQKQFDAYRLISHNDEVELWHDWFTDKGRLSYEQMLPNTIEVHGLRALSLDYVEAWKRWMNRPKDQADTRLIAEYKKGQSV